MSFPRSGFVLTSVMNMGIFALGGFDSSSRLATVECYNVEEREWKHMSDMQMGRSNFGACQINSKIYVFGGFDGIGLIVRNVLCVILLRA